MEKKFQEELGTDIKKSRKVETIAAFVILGVFAIAAGAGAWWYMASLPSYDTAETKTVSSTSTKDKTSDWKTYTNDVFGFELKYPKTWILTDKLQTVKTEPGAANKGLSIVSASKYNLNLWINPDGFGMENISKSYSYNSAKIEASKIVLGEKTVSEVNPEGDGSFMVTTTITSGADRYIFALTGADMANIDEADDYFTKILGTLVWE